MLDREACERRVYRLAVLLTGDPVAAARVIEEVVGGRRDLRDLDSPHLDRLTILRCRESGSKRRRRRFRASTAADDEEIIADTAARSVLEAMDGMPPQLREAWVLTSVYRLDPREAARSMDCSVTATERHIVAGGKALEKVLAAPTAAAAAESLLRYSVSLDVPAFHRARIRRRRRWRLAWRLGAVALAVIALGALGGWFWRQLYGP